VQTSKGFKNFYFCPPCFIFAALFEHNLIHCDSMSKREPLVKIKISHLSQGQHHYRFTHAICDFRDAAFSDNVFSHPVETTVTIDKGLSDMSVTICVKTVAILECDRCLAELHRSISGEYRIFYAPAKSVHTQNLQDEVRLLGKNDFEIDLTDDVRDTLLLALPMKNVCEPACSHRTGTTSLANVAGRTTPETDWQQALSQISQKLNLQDRPKSR
jgi:uncharacterized protein